MNVGSILTNRTPSFRFMDCGNRAGASTFGGMLSETSQSGGSIHMYLPREGTLYSGGRGYQTVYAEYAAGSTPEDPVALVKGESASGAYEFTCHIKDIDPAHASYAELCALWGYLKESGQSPIELSYPYARVVPDGVEVGDVARKQDFAGKISAAATSQMFDASNQLYAKKLLELYSGWAKAA